MEQRPRRQAIPLKRLGLQLPEVISLFLAVARNGSLAVFGLLGFYAPLEVRRMCDAMRLDPIGL